MCDWACELTIMFHKLKICCKLSSFFILVLTCCFLSPQLSLSVSLSGHVTQQQTCGNCSDAVKLKASPEPQKKQQKETWEQPQNVDKNLCICQADLVLLKTALSLTVEICHHTTYCFIRDRKAVGFDIVKFSSPLQMLLHLSKYLQEYPCQG